MLRNASQIVGHTIEATDGRVGSVADLLFDDRQWTVRWIVIDTGGWLADRQVLLAPAMLDEVPERGGEGGDVFRVGLTRWQVEQSPGIGTDEPVSLQHELRLYEHYGQEPYWAGGDPFSGIGNPGAPHWAATGDRPPAEGEAAPETGEPHAGDPHLRSAREIIGYAVEARDGDIGDVEDFLIGPDAIRAVWAIRYLTVDAGRWLPGRHVLMSPRWLSKIDWKSRSVRVDRCRRDLKDAPAYDADTEIDRAYEERLYRWFGQPGYWI